MWQRVIGFHACPGFLAGMHEVNPFIIITEIKHVAACDWFLCLPRISILKCTEWHWNNFYPL